MRCLISWGDSVSLLLLLIKSASEKLKLCADKFLWHECSQKTSVRSSVPLYTLLRPSLNLQEKAGNFPRVAKLLFHVCKPSRHDNVRRKCCPVTRCSARTICENHSHNRQGLGWRCLHLGCEHLCRCHKAVKVVGIIKHSVHQFHPTWMDITESNLVRRFVPCVS